MKSHERTYIIIFDIPARIARKLQIKERFFEIFSCLLGESFDIGDFLCGEYQASAYVEVNWISDISGVFVVFSVRMDV